jgi:hypothetical protein
MTKEPIFNIRQSNAHRNIIRLVIMLTTAIVSIVWGRYLLPENFTLLFSLSDLKFWDGWLLIGLVLISTGVITLIKEGIFDFHSLNNNKGEWLFSLTDDHLTWNVPNHFHGYEVGFNASLSEIKEIEFRTITRHEEMNKREYWIHFYEREPIQLQSYSGFSVSSLVSKICNEGVKYIETHIQ